MEAAYDDFQSTILKKYTYQSSQHTFVPAALLELSLLPTQFFPPNSTCRCYAKLPLSRLGVLANSENQIDCMYLVSLVD